MKFPKPSLPSFDPLKPNMPSGKTIGLGAAAVLVLGGLYAGNKRYPIVRTTIGSWLNPFNYQFVRAGVAMLGYQIEPIANAFQPDATVSEAEQAPKQVLRQPASHDEASLDTEKNSAVESDMQAVVAASSIKPN